MGDKRRGYGTGRLISTQYLRLLLEIHAELQINQAMSTDLLYICKSRRN